MCPTSCDRFGFAKSSTQHNVVLSWNEAQRHSKPSLSIIFTTDGQLWSDKVQCQISMFLPVKMRNTASDHDFRSDKLHFNYWLQHVVVHFVITELTAFHNLTIMEQSDEGDSTQSSWSDVNCSKWPLLISVEKSRAEVCPPAYFSHHQKPQPQHEHKAHLKCSRCISVQLSACLSAKGQITPSPKNTGRAGTMWWNVPK